MPKRKIAGETTLAKARQAHVDRQGQRCTVIGCTGRPVQAAHIMPAGQGGHIVFENIMLLCLDHHTAYDQYRWQLPITMLSPESRVYLASRAYLWLHKDGSIGGRGARRFAA